MIFFKKVIRGTFKNIAESFKIIIFYSRGLIVDKFIKILIAKTKLNIKPILVFFFYKAGIVTGDARTRLYRPEDNSDACGGLCYFHENCRFEHESFVV